jgi:predicted RNA-binding protein with PUA-like domain
MAVRLTRSLARIIPLDELRTTPELAQMQLLRRGNRLSVMPVTEAEYACILRLV